MSQAPPVEPPIVFPIMSTARVRSTIWSLLIYGFMLYVGITGYRMDSARHRSIVIDIVFTIVGLLFFALSSLSWLRDQGSQIVVQGNRIELRSGSGAVRLAGLITDIVKLQASQNVTQKKPWSYSVVFKNRLFILIDRNIPNLESLIQLLEQRTGRKFEIKRS